MRKVIWTDKELIELKELIDVQGLVESHLKDLVASFLYSASGVVGPASFKVTADSPSSGKVIIPPFTAVQNGNIINTVKTTLDIFGGVASPAIPDVYVDPAGSMSNTTALTPRTDIIVCQYDGTTYTDEPKTIWHVDPVAHTKSTTYENTRTVDSYKWGILRGTPSGAPHPPVAGWFEVARVNITANNFITDITTVTPIGTVTDIFNPITGHKHLGVPPDAPQLIHGPKSGIDPQSIDATTIGADDHHSQIHMIGDTANHSGFLTNALHGFLTSSAPAPFIASLHNFSALTDFDIGSPASKLSPSQHGPLASITGGAALTGTQLHREATVYTPGFLSVRDKQKLVDYANSGLTLHKGTITGITSFVPYVQVAIPVPTPNSPVIVQAIIRGHDAYHTGAYSRWHRMPFNIPHAWTDQYSPTAHYFANFSSQVFVDDNFIYFSMQTDLMYFDDDGWSYQNFGFNTYPIDGTLFNNREFYMYNDSGVLTNIWDQWEIRYIILTKVNL